MFALRRAAARAVFIQPARQLSTIRPASRIAPFQIERSAISRSFHQSRRWLADEEQKKPDAASPAEAQTSGETVTTEPSEAELKKIRSESVLETAKESTEQAAETAQEKAQETAEEAKSTASSVVEQAQEFASSAAETVQNVASSAARTVRQQFPPHDSGASLDRANRQSTPGKILYIGNLFFEVTTAQLEAEFGRYGEIVNSRVVSDNKGLSKGFGYIEFASQESADRAVREQDQQVFQGRRMAVQYHVRREPRAGVRSTDRARSLNQPSKTLFIGNMSYQMSDKDLNDLFKSVRDVLDVRVAIDRRSGQPRGFAHADFVDVAAAQRAKAELEQKVVYGRQLRIDYSASTGGEQQR